MKGEALQETHAATRTWFAQTFAAPTPAQSRAWQTAATGRSFLLSAPTGSGKTLAAFLWSIDRLLHTAPPREGVSTLYVSPLKALATDVEKNLRLPLQGIRAAADTALPDISVGIRSGDTPATQRRRLVKQPPDILITTPESLYLMLTSRARETLRGIDTVIVDEVHAIAGSKRGAHLALSLERLDLLLAKPARRIGLSATVRPIERVARFLAGGQPIDVIDAAAGKQLDLSVVVPVDDMAQLPMPPVPVDDRGPSMWPHVEAAVLDLVRQHDSTIIFANSRRLAERFCNNLNDLAGEPIARAHHGSVSHDQRLEIESALKSGSLPAVVATSSLELGIDMGTVDLVVQIEAPTSVASGLQRIGRAGHRVGAASKGIVFPKFRGDLLEAAVVVERMKAGAIEEIEIPENPLDVLAQQIVAMVAMDDWQVGDLASAIKRADGFRNLPSAALRGVLDMLSGRYPADAFSGLRARINWDRKRDVLSARAGAHSIAVTSGGTIPDRGLYGVFLSGEKRTRVGELDEEMVHETRVGEIFILGSSSWRVDEITADRVLVSPAPGMPGRMPFWHGDAPGRPLELGAALGAFVREKCAAAPAERIAALRDGGCDDRAARNLSDYLDAQMAATESVPDDHTIVLEKFRDAVGDWRLCIHSFFGARVHAPWTQAIVAALRDRLGVDVQVIYGDDGIVVRIPDGDDFPARETFFPDADEVENIIVRELGNSALFAARFREAAARALLLPRRRPGGRTPLWLQRQKSTSLLQVARRHESFPIVLETYRECLNDVFDLPALVQILDAIERREIRVVEVETSAPSPFATSLQLAYTATFLYDGDAPLAERRAQALALDRTALAELLGREELRDLLDGEVLEELECELQHLLPQRRGRCADDAYDLLCQLGDLSVGELAARCRAGSDVEIWLGELRQSGRATPIHLCGEERWIAAQDACLYRDALAADIAADVPGELLDESERPLHQLVARRLRSNGPLTDRQIADRFGLGRAVVAQTLGELERDNAAVRGEFRPNGHGREWIDPQVLRRLRRRSLAALRSEVEPVAVEDFVRLAIAWNGIGAASANLSARDGIAAAVDALQGAPLAASLLERQILASRVPGYAPRLLDDLCASGEVVWGGAGAIAERDGWIALASAEHAATLLPPPLEEEDALPAMSARVVAALRQHGALFFRQLAEAVGDADDGELLAALWHTVWSGWTTNDTLAPLRQRLRARRRRSAAAGKPARRRPATLRASGPGDGAGRWSLLPERGAEPTRRAHLQAEILLRRHGVVTRGALASERIDGGYGAVYPVLRAMEERGHCRRGYFVEGLGGSQFALSGAVDRMRSLGQSASDTVVLAATDPANPFGAAIAWPERVHVAAQHRAGRKVGANVVIANGTLLLYLERGGRTMLTYTTDGQRMNEATAALAAATADGRIPPFELTHVDGNAAATSWLAPHLTTAGFRRTHRGYEARGQ